MTETYFSEVVMPRENKLAKEVSIKAKYVTFQHF